MDKLPVQRILSDSDNQRLLPPAVRHVHVRLAYKYDVPIGRQWYKYKQLYDGSLSLEELRVFGDEPYGCHAPELAPFRPPGCDHVCTPDAAFLEHLRPDVPALAQIWREGSKFRPQSRTPVTEEDRQAALSSLERAMGKLSKKLSKEVPAHTLYPWISTVMQQIYASMDAIPADTMIGHDDSPVYGRRERLAMKDILQTYLCTPVDKLANGMCLTCKHFAVKMQLDDLARNSADGGSTYQALPNTSVDDVVAIAEPILEQLQIKMGDGVLPGYMGMPKLHKPHLAFRFIATSAKSYLRPLALILTYLLRALEAHLDSSWRQLHFPATASMGRSRHWILRNSAQLLPVVHAFNMQHSLRRLDESTAEKLSWDFERLYTELNQDDLKVRLCWLLDSLFALHGNRNLIRVAKGCPARWCEGTMPARRTARYQGRSYYCFDLESAKQALCFLIDNTYFQVGDTVFHQVKGIPMGTNPAVFFANYYLFVYEYIFMRDAIQVHDALPPRSALRLGVVRVLKAFKFTRRFVDDLSVITYENPDFVSGFLFNDQVQNGVHGIYPRPLVLNATTVQNGRILRSLDVEVFPANSVSGPLFTRLYDKRRQPGFTHARNVMRFPAWSSKLSTKCKLNVFDSQFVRFARIISDVGNFITEVVSLICQMVWKGYPKATLLRRCRFRIARFPFLFGVARGLSSTGRTRPRGLYKAIKDRVDNRT